MASCIRTLYICYFGLREPLVQTQVLPYLRQLKLDGIEVSLLTFEPELQKRWAKQELLAEHARLATEQIKWIYLPYHKRPSLPATLYDIVAGARVAARLMRREGVNVLHARSHVGAAIGALAKWRRGGQMIFDIRGFMPEEYTDAGRWAENGYLYRGTKAVERRLMSAADAFVVLTERARDLLFPGCADRDDVGRPIEVIPCCIDSARFRVADNLSKEQLREELDLTNRRVIVYVGALGGWYMTDEMAEFLAAAHQQDESTLSLILTQSPPEIMTERLRRAGVTEKDFLVRQVAPEDVPRYLKASDIALAFIRACYSKLSSSPTKIAEYLASGLPIVCGAGVGDVDKVIETDRVGVIVREFNRDAYLKALCEVDRLRRDAETAARCRASAYNRFDLGKVGGEKYRRLYQRLSEKEQQEPYASKIASAES